MHTEETNKEGINEMKTYVEYLGVLVVLTLWAVVGVSSAQLPPPLPGADVAAPEEIVQVADNNNVSISVTEARIQDVLRSLAAMRTGTTIMIDPAVQGNVSFELQDVPWEMALQLVAEQQGLVITQRSENIFVVEQASGVAKKAEEGISIELFSTKDIEEMEDFELLKLVGPPDFPEAMSADEIRTQLMQKTGYLIKRLSVANKSAVEVIEALAKESSIDFVFSTHFQPRPAAGQPAGAPGAPVSAPSTLPPISLNMTNQTLPSVLRIIADQGGLSVTMQNGVWVVKPLRAEEIQLEPLVTETFRVRYIPVDDKLQKDVKAILSTRGLMSTRGKIITVFDTADRIAKVSRIINDQDIPTPQVLIEARFYVVDTTESDELGIDWVTLSTGASDGGGMDFSIRPDANMTWQYLEGNLVSDPDIHTATLTLPQLNAVLRALKNNTNAKQLSNPKIIVSSDQQATIHIGRQRPITESSIDTSGETSVITYKLDETFGDDEQKTVYNTRLKDDPGAAMDVTYSGYKGYLDLGTKLTVFPSVKTEDEVYIRIIPELINNPDDLILGNQVFPILLRTIVQTEFSIRSGQTIAIGGLVNEETSEIQHKVPFLGSLPFIGRAFRYDSEEKVRSETIIFLTVKVLSSQEVDTTTGIPVRARKVQELVDDIRIEDADGGVYSEEKAKSRIEEMERLEEEGKLLNRLKKFHKETRKPQEEKEEEMSVTVVSVIPDDENAIDASDEDQIVEEAVEVMEDVDVEAGVEEVEIEELVVPEEALAEDVSGEMSIQPEEASAEDVSGEMPIQPADVVEVDVEVK